MCNLSQINDDLNIHKAKFDEFVKSLPEVDVNSTEISLSGDSVNLKVWVSDETIVGGLGFLSIDYPSCKVVNDTTPLSRATVGCISDAVANGTYLEGANAKL